MMKRIRKTLGSIRKMLRKPPRVWWLAAQALFLSARYRRLILCRPFAQLSPKIGQLKLETAVEPLDEPTIRDVQFAVRGVCNHTPWQSKCLVQALTAKKLLNRRGLPCTLYMGVMRGKGGEMQAHAWLRCGNILVTGGAAARYYTVTTIYGDREPQP